MLTRKIGTMIVLRENNDTPHDAEWDGFLRLLSDNRNNFERMKILVVTDGGGPNASQRKRLEGTLSGKPVRVAVVTDSAKSRFIASAISLINRDHKGFSMKEIGQAYQHLDMTSSECREAELALKEMEPLIAR
jgi:hypothetical protein